MIKQVVVLAGGLATRLYPITKKVPKAMVPVAGKPFLEHQIAQFKEHGIEEVVMCVGHLSEQIVDYFGDGSEFGISMVYSKEDSKLDTGGAIKLALPYLAESFFVIYGDSYLSQSYTPVVDFYEQHKEETGSRGLMTVYKNDNDIEPSRVLLDDIFVKKYQKDPPPPNAHYMEYGLNIFEREIIDQVDGQVFPISDYFDLLSPKKQLLAFEVKERFYEIGSHDGLAETEVLLES